MRGHGQLDVDAAPQGRLAMDVDQIVFAI